jgi:RHS repeat-associated protein
LQFEVRNYEDKAVLWSTTVPADGNVNGSFTPTQTKGYFVSLTANNPTENPITIIVDNFYAYTAPINTADFVSLFKPDVVDYNDYYPFGSLVPNRHGSSGSYRYGFNGKEKDDEIKGEGNSIDFGSRMYDPRVGRWFKTDGKQQKYPGHSPYHFAYNSPIITIDPDGNENIVIAGGQHDASKANKLMFAHQAIRQLQQYKKNEKGETRTLVIFTEGYSQKQLNSIEVEAKKLGANVVRVNSASEVVNYINSKNQTNSNLTNVRVADKVTNIDTYSHGHIGTIDFGNEQPNANAAKFDADCSTYLNPKAFGKSAVFASYACRTGLGGTNTKDFIVPGFSKPSQSLAQSIADNAGILVKAFMKRTSYDSTLGNGTDTFNLKMATILGGEKTDWFKTWQEREKSRQQLLDGAIFDPKGAVHPVEAGNTPYGVSSDMQTYTPKKR